MRTAAHAARHQAIALLGVVERNAYLVKRYGWWELAFFLWTGADFGAALLLLAVASVSFVGIGMVTAVLPLISPEKGAQLGFIAQGLLLVVSGVYYPVSVLPQWMQWLATISPATYALRGIRAAILEGAGLGALWGDVWPLLIIGAVSVPLGLWV